MVSKSFFVIRAVLALYPALPPPHFFADAFGAVLALSAVTAAVGLLVWLLLIPEYTYGFLWLVLQYTGVFRLAISALLSATFAALALLLVKHLRPEDLERYKAAPLLASLVLFLNIENHRNYPDNF